MLDIPKTTYTNLALDGQELKLPIKTKFNKIEDIELRDCYFSKCTLSEHFKNIFFNRCEFINCNFLNCSFSNSCFQGCGFYDGATFQQCIFEASVLEYIIFGETSVEFDSCTFRKTRIKDLDLKNQIFKRCSLFNVTFKNVKIESGDRLDILNYRDCTFFNSGLLKLILDVKELEKIKTDLNYN